MYLGEFLMDISNNGGENTLDQLRIVVGEHFAVSSVHNSPMIYVLTLGPVQRFEDVHAQTRNLCQELEARVPTLHVTGNWSGIVKLRKGK